MDRILIEKVQNLRNEGKSFGEISKELLITKSNASYCSKIDLKLKKDIHQSKNY